MPDFITTPAEHSYAGGEQVFNPFLPGAASAAYVGQNVTLAVNWDGFSLGNIRLDRLAAGDQIVGKDGQALLTFQRIYEANVDETEKAINANSNAILAIQEALNLASQAQSQAQAAQAAAAEAAAASALSNSYTSPATVLSADTSGTVTIAAHTRVYGDGTQVAVDGGSLTGYAVGVVVRPYYDDVDRTGGAVAYSAVTDETLISQTNGRHLLGAARIPTTGNPPSGGAPVYPPGYDGIGDIP